MIEVTAAVLDDHSSVEDEGRAIAGSRFEGRIKLGDDLHRVEID